MEPFAKILADTLRPNHSGKRERHLIVLKDRNHYRQCLIHLKQLGIQPVKKLKSIHAVSCEFPKQTNLARLHKHPMVKRVERDVQIRIHETHSSAASILRNRQIIPWGIQRVQVPEVWHITQGSPVKVAVLDTGISRHPDLRIAGSFNAVQRGKPAVDANGHGTHVAGTIAALNNTFGVVGVAPKIRLYNVKAFRKDGSASLADIIEGIEWCIQNKIQVINMSFGSNEKSEALQEIIRQAYNNGIVMIASAGNEGSASGQIDYPARFPETIAVAATTRNNRIAGFSSRGTGIDLAAPGVDILSTYLRGTYRRLSGTSMAAPHVTGAAAMIRSIQPAIAPSQIKNTLQLSAKRLPGFSDDAQGAGLLQLLPVIGKQ